ncbi:integral membrane protein, partial [Saccharothrix sp. ST-888]
MKPLRLRLLLGIAIVAAVLSWAGAKLWDSF